MDSLFRGTQRTLFASALLAGLFFLNSQSFAKNEKARTFWMQQKNLKVLSELPGGENQVEAYLDIFHEVLTRLLKRSPELGSLVYNVRRDTVILSSLSNVDFETQVLLPLQAELDQRISDQIKFPGKEKSWKEWARKNTIFGTGRSSEEAYINMRSREFGMTFEKWKISTLALRSELLEKSVS